MKKTLLLSTLFALALGGCTVEVTIDIDDDGVDDRDEPLICVGTVSGEPVDAEGCSTLDDDGDGVTNDYDLCPETPAGETVTDNGCANDADGDGVTNDMDSCPGTPAGVPVDADGCPDDVTFEGSWTVNGEAASEASCGIVDTVQLRVSAGFASDSFDFDCATGGFDGMDGSVSIPFDTTVVYSYAVFIDGQVLPAAVTEDAEVDLSGNTDLHVTIPVIDLEVDVAHEFTIETEYETALGSDTFGTCAEAGVDDVTFLWSGEGVSATVGCTQSFTLTEAEVSDLGPGSYTLTINADNAAGTKWGGSCTFEFDGGVQTVGPCRINVVP